MIVLRAIGKFFARIGRWIRDTAWVQPLLIVGGIFAIIFSIPHIIDWVETWFDSGDNSTAYYTKFKLDEEGAEDGKSDADKLLNYLESYAKGEANDTPYGKKFFVSFVQEHCADCETNYSAFQTLQANWTTDKNSAFAINDNNEFNFYTIFIDSVNDDAENLFKEYLFPNHYIFFENLANDYYEAPYILNKSSVKSSLENLDNVDSFSSPTTILIDLDTESNAATTNSYGVSEIFFLSEGNDKYERAGFLRDCWNHEGIFSYDYTK